MGSVCNAQELVKWSGFDVGELGCEHCSVFRMIQAANVFDKMRYNLSHSVTFQAT